MAINIIFRTKCTCDMASYAYKMHNVEQMFMTYSKVNVQKKTFLNYFKNIPYHRETNISHNVDFDFLYNRINICAWRQAFTCHQARLSQVSEHVKIHSFIYP